jgi:CDP-diacylglycerol--glycerol-3-phosphate 3-phosphatidyltransferase
VGLPLVAALLLMAVLQPLFALDPTIAFHPVAVAGTSWAGQLWYVSYSVGTAPSHGLLGLANAMTIARGALYAVVAGFVVVPSDTTLAWVPALCYGTGAVLDRLDGALARSIGRETAIGERLDMAFDTFGFVVGALVAVLWGALPVYYLSLSAARYVYVGALRVREWRGRPVHDRPDSDLGKYLAGVQMAFVTVALAPAVPTELIHGVAPLVLAPSLAVFGRDFLIASGRLGRED